MVKETMNNFHLHVPSGLNSFFKYELFQFLVIYKNKSLIFHFIGMVIFELRDFYAKRTISKKTLFQQIRFFIT